MMGGVREWGGGGGSWGERGAWRRSGGGVEVKMGRQRACERALAARRPMI